MLKPVEFVIVVPSYNNAKWCIKNLTSIAEQEYPHFSLYYINDLSDDATQKRVERFLASSSLKNRTTLINNTKRKGSLANFYETIHQIDPHKVIVCVDGDDWLAHPHVLERVAEVYADPRIWLTFGDFESNPPGLRGSCEPIPLEVIKAHRFREYPWVSSHLKTFYAQLFQLIKKKDLQHDKAFFPMAGDLAFMLPMLEMAARGHFQFIPEVLYIYNLKNPLRDYKVDEVLQKRLSWIIRDKKPYTPLKKLF